MRCVEFEDDIGFCALGLTAELSRRQELLDSHIVAAAKKEEQLNAEKRHLKNRSAELEILLEERESELETMRTENTAQAAKARAQIEKLSSELIKQRATADEVRSMQLWQTPLFHCSVSTGSPQLRCSFGRILF